MESLRPDTEVALLLEELESLDAELKRRRRERGIEFYVPNPLQHQAHQSARKTILYIGGNRAGKSTFGATELVMHLTRQYPDYIPQARRFTKPIKAVIVATSFPIVERVIEPKLLDYLPKDYIRHIKRTPQGYVSRLTCVDGSTVDILTNEMDDLSFESADWDVFWGDEPQQKRKFYAIQRGLVDRQGLTLLTFTPLVEPWIKEELVDKAPAKGITVVQASMYDNQQDIQGHPILPKAAIERFEAELPDDLRKTRVYGEFFHLRGVVYPEYNPIVHEWEERLPDRPGYQYPDPVLSVLDPHDRNPHHVLWAFVTREDHLYVDRELVLRATLKDLAKAMLVTEAQAGYRIVRRLIDPNFGRSPAEPGSACDVIGQLAKPPFPLKFSEGLDDKTAGHLRVKELLRYDRQQPLSFTNRPQLYFHRLRCPQTIHSVKNYQFDEWVGKTKSDRDDKEVPKQKDTHGADCLRYLAMSNPTYDRLIHKTVEPAGALY